MKLLVATHNPGKAREYRAILSDLPLEVTWLDAEGITLEVEETGATFAENALIKATGYASLTGLWTWADDSGLVVDALDGRPGVYSARYAGPGAADADRYRRVLEEMRAFPRDRWTARFVCAVALALPSPGGMQTHVVEDTLEGVLDDRPRGEFGFGYDPIFFLPEMGRTLAEVEPAVKNRISHRAKAARRTHDLLLRLLDAHTSAADQPGAPGVDR